MRAKSHEWAYSTCLQNLSGPCILFVCCGNAQIVVPCCFGWFIFTGIDPGQYHWGGNWPTVYSAKFLCPSATKTQCPGGGAGYRTCANSSRRCAATLQYSHTALCLVTYNGCLISSHLPHDCTSSEIGAKLCSVPGKNTEYISTMCYSLIRSALLCATAYLNHWPIIRGIQSVVLFVISLVHVSDSD